LLKCDDADAILSGKVSKLERSFYGGLIPLPISLGRIAPT
jgi:hypothetical protein